MEVPQPWRAEAAGAGAGVIVGEKQAGLARAAREVLIAELQRREVVLSEEQRVAPAVGLSRKRVHDQEVTLKWFCASQIHDHFSRLTFCIFFSLLCVKKFL